MKTIMTVVVTEFTRHVDVFPTRKNHIVRVTRADPSIVGQYRILLVKDFATGVFRR